MIQTFILLLNRSENGAIEEFWGLGGQYTETKNDIARMGSSSSFQKQIHRSFCTDEVSNSNTLMN